MPHEIVRFGTQRFVVTDKRLFNYDWATNQLFPGDATQVYEDLPCEEISQDFVFPNTGPLE